MAPPSRWTLGLRWHELRMWPRGLDPYGRPQSMKGAAMRWDAGDLRRVCAVAIAGLGVLTVPACGSDEPAEAEDTTTSTTETTIRRTTTPT